MLRWSRSNMVVRGVDRRACFRAAGDYDACLDDLMHGAGKSDCAIHAYVLMTNHVHLLVTGSMPGSVSRLMQRVGRRYVHRFNASWFRTGTLFEGRFRASLVESDRYLLTCMRYIELNPVRAGMVASATDYRWSSVHANAGSRPDRLVTPHERYRALGSNDGGRRISLHPRPSAAQVRTRENSTPPEHRLCSGQRDLSGRDRPHDRPQRPC